MSEEMMTIPNTLSICIQPHEGTHIRFQAKEPDTDQEMQSVEMVFRYDDWFETPLPEAYERLLVDALEGDSTLFARSDGIEVAWRLIDPIIQGWLSGDAPEMSNYEPGSTGPYEADVLLARDERAWIEGCMSRARTFIGPKYNS
jgi:glucose-6-phosphate 1-dehydrogenase